MKQSAIFWPLTVQVLLTLVVTIRMYHARIAELRSRRIRPQELATSRGAASLENVAAADNFRNLFELPVLFLCGLPHSLHHQRGDAAAAHPGVGFCRFPYRSQFYPHDLQSRHASFSRICPEHAEHLFNVGGVRDSPVARRLTLHAAFQPG